MNDLLNSTAPPPSLLASIGIAILTLLLLLLIGLSVTIYLLLSRRHATQPAAARHATGTQARQTRPLPLTSTGDSAQAAYALVVRIGGTPGQEYPLIHMNTFVGADRGLVDLVLDDEYVSGRHASVQIEGDALYVTDLGSSNGTRVNAEPLLPHVRMLLRPADRLTIGGLTLECARRAQAPAIGAPRERAGRGEYQATSLA